MRVLVLSVVLVIACKSSKEATPAIPPPAATAGAVDVHVDRRVELFSLLHRLNNAREYMATPTTKYVAAVDAHFASFKDHAAVVATRELREAGIGYDGPMWLAVQLDDKLQLRAPPLDPRWASVDIEAYLTKVRDFVATSDFDGFLAKHRDYFARVEERMRTAIEKENPRAWFDDFFGARPGATFVVVPSLLVGTHNFGPHTKDELYQLIGVVRVDFDELPTFDGMTLELTIHEMAHSYINPMFEKHRAALQPHGERLFAHVADAMRKQAYPRWDIFLNEQGVRAVTAFYLRERKGTAAGDAAIAREEARGFKSTRALVDLFGEYRRTRQEDSDVEALVPRIAAVLASVP